MDTSIHLLQLNREIRDGICQGCSHRTELSTPVGDEVARECEVHCPVMKHLPHLLAIAQRLDPMVGNVDPAIRSAIQQIEERGHGKRRLTKHADRIVAVIKRVCG